MEEKHKTIIVNCLMNSNDVQKMSGILILKLSVEDTERNKASIPNPQYHLL